MLPIDMDEIEKFEMEVGWFQEYSMYMEAFLEEKREYHSSEIEDLKKELNDKEITPEQFNNISSDDRFYLEALDWHKNILRRSFLVSIYSFMEHKLTKECLAKESITQRRFFEVKANNDLERVRSFCQHELHIDFPDKTPGWNEIRYYRMLRNCIVHHSSMVNDDRKSQELINYVMTKHGLLSIYAGEVFIEKDFCLEVYETIKVFLFLILYGERPPD